MPTTSSAPTSAIQPLLTAMRMPVKASSAPQQAARPRRNVIHEPAPSVRAALHQDLVDLADAELGVDDARRERGDEDDERLRQSSMRQTRASRSAPRRTAGCNAAARTPASAPRATAAATRTARRAAVRRRSRQARPTPSARRMPRRGRGDCCRRTGHRQRCETSTKVAGDGNRRGGISADPLVTASHSSNSRPSDAAPQIRALPGIASGRDGGWRAASVAYAASRADQGANARANTCIAKESNAPSTPIVAIATNRIPVSSVRDAFSAM